MASKIFFFYLNKKVNIFYYFRHYKKQSLYHFYFCLSQLLNLDNRIAIRILEFGYARKHLDLFYYICPLSLSSNSGRLISNFQVFSLVYLYKKKKSKCISAEIYLFIYKLYTCIIVLTYYTNYKTFTRFEIGNGKTEMNMVSLIFSCYTPVDHSAHSLQYTYPL